MTTPTPPPWLSPKVLMRKSSPKWLDTPTAYGGSQGRSSFVLIAGAWLLMSGGNAIDTPGGSDACDWRVNSLSPRRTTMGTVSSAVM